MNGVESFAWDQETPGSPPILFRTGNGRGTRSQASAARSSNTARATAMPFSAAGNPAYTAI